MKLRHFYKYTLFFVLALITFDAVSQQRPVISQYMLNGLVLNPAYAGRHDYTSFSAMYRDQWVNVPGAPRLSVATAQTGFKDRNLGLGLLIANDEIGIHNNYSVYGSYAYRLRLTNSAVLSMGIQGGFDYLRSDYNKLNLRDPGDNLLTGVENDFRPNFGAGFFYYDRSSYVGFSIPYILSNRQLESDEFFRDVKIARYYYLTAGKLFQASPRLIIKPSLLIRMQDQNPLAFDVNVNFYLDDIIGLGASYRFNDSVIGIFEFQVNDFIKFSYAYDWVLSQLTQFTRGTHEIMLNYRINFNAPRKHRMCPGPLYF